MRRQSSQSQQAGGDSSAIGESPSSESNLPSPAINTFPVPVRLRFIGRERKTHPTARNGCGMASQKTVSQSLTAFVTIKSVATAGFSSQFKASYCGRLVLTDRIHATCVHSKTPATFSHLVLFVQSAHGNTKSRPCRFFHRSSLTIPVFRMTLGPRWMTHISPNPIHRNSIQVSRSSHSMM